MPIREVASMLEKLLQGTNSLQKPIITGYNYHSSTFQFEKPHVLTFSQLHERDSYFKAALEDIEKLGFPEVNSRIKNRDKKGHFRWSIDFFLRDTDGNLEEGLKIRDIKLEQYVNLTALKERTLREAGFAEEYNKRLIAENSGREMSFTLNNDEELKALAELFLQKSYSALFDDDGRIVPETTTELKQRNPWPDAHDSPILIIGGELNNIENLSGFTPANLFRYSSDQGEYNFVVHNKYQELKNTEEIKQLKKAGMKEEKCLANKPFILQYVDHII